MTTIVRVRSSGETGVLVGTGFATYSSARPGLFWGNLSPTKEQGQAAVAAISDADGSIHWAFTHDVEVVTVDGASPREILAG